MKENFAYAMWTVLKKFVPKMMNSNYSSLLKILNPFGRYYAICLIVQIQIHCSDLWCYCTKL